EAHPFIETNIRTVFIHHFFNDHTVVADNELLPLVQASLDKANPREWYWALMDYGAYLKASVGNLSRVSKHYAKQSAFSDSNRQLRGQVLRLLAGSKHSEMKLQTILPDQRLQVVLATLQKERLITRQGRYYLLPS
ncbi:MAG TPA: A/G-specific adenine glycosylase, partial [Patescibacteria group bacterium]|nr:A/G-specific adenine glycosylase [Patescibacteria group bacterium]